MEGQIHDGTELVYFKFLSASGQRKRSWEDIMPAIWVAFKIKPSGVRVRAAMHIDIVICTAVINYGSLMKPNHLTKCAFDAIASWLID